MVSIVEDSRERYFDEGEEVGYKKGAEAGYIKGANAVVSRIADSVLKTSEIDRVPISTVLDRSHYDDDLRREVEAEIERRGANRGGLRW